MESLQTIPIQEIYESLTNPRRIFRKMDDLIQSVREKGVLIPLLVRATDDGYEIIAGARRHRAAIAAGLLHLPAIVKNVSDEEALEIQVLENLQREDVNPLDEADGYKALLERTSYDVATLALKVGKSETYIYQRLKLVDLNQKFRDALCEDRITISHAILLARLTQEDQEKAFDVVFDEYEDEKDHPCSVKELTHWIDNEIHLDLKKAAFKLIDADLLPDVGDCISCAKRTGFVPQLFPDVAKKDTCTDGACYKRKLQAHIDRELAKAQKKNKALTPVSSSYRSDDKSILQRDKYHPIAGKEDRCESAHKAIVTEGPSDRGKIIEICTNPECPMHWKKNQAPAEESSWEKEQREQKEKRKKEGAIRKALYEEICSIPSPLSENEEKRIIALTLVELLERGYSDALSLLGKGTKEVTIGQAIKNQIPSFSDEDLDGTILRLCLCRQILVPNWGDFDRPELLTKIAELFNIDVKAIEKKIASNLRKKAKTSPGETKTKKRGIKSANYDTPANCGECVNTDEAECVDCPHYEALVD